MSLFSSFVLLAYLITVLAGARRELIMTQVMFRHGARNTLHGELLVGDPDREDLIRNRAELTGVGMRQLYQLGSMVRNEYILTEGLLKDSFNSSEILIMSSNENRTLQSAQSFMAGLYPFGSGEKLKAGIDSSLLLPPFDSDGFNQDAQFDGYALPKGAYLSAIHSFGTEEDAVLNPKCKKWKKQRETLEIQHSRDIQTEIDKNEKVIERITNNHVKIPSNFLSSNVTKLWDIVHCQKYRGFDYGISKDDFETLMYLKTYTKAITKFPIDHSHLIASPFFYFVFQQFDLKISNKSSLKMIVESTHDGQVFPAMIALNLFNFEHFKNDHRLKTQTSEKFPPFATNIIFELYNKYNIDDTQSQEQEIRVRFNGNYIPICNGLDYCSYSKFKSQIQKIMSTPEQYEQVCGFTPSIYKEETPKQPQKKEKKPEKEKEQSKKEVPWLFFICYLVLITVIVALLLHIFKLHKRIQEEYLPLSSQHLQERRSQI